MCLIGANHLLSCVGVKNIQYDNTVVSFHVFLSGKFYFLLQYIIIFDKLIYKTARKFTNITKSTSESTGVFFSKTFGFHTFGHLGENPQKNLKKRQKISLRCSISNCILSSFTRSVCNNLSFIAIIS